ncbi:hypothetical protein EDD16DRAFT_1517816 [Pisolithus croceorrhizus]|nr:hypothetical protein EV401DRAFT_1892214 [Pisolithus croceorrhizus]KAI6123620.1 hypothetical protein EDD16DRAFT_1517816 [Pisolithus croceorrhizus]
MCPSKPTFRSTKSHGENDDAILLQRLHAREAEAAVTAMMPRLLRHNETNSNDDLPLPSPPPSLSSLSLKVMRLLFLVHPHTHVPVIQTFPYLLCKVMRAILLHVLADEVMLSECAGEGGGNWYGERNAVKREMNRGLQETKWYARPCEDQGGGVDMSMLGDDVYEDVEGTSERDSEYFRDSFLGPSVSARGKGRKARKGISDFTLNGLLAGAVTPPDENTIGGSERARFAKTLAKVAGTEQQNKPRRERGTHLKVTAMCFSHRMREHGAKETYNG